MDEKEVVKAESKELSTSVADLNFTGFEGIENDAGAFSIPFLKIANTMSSELDEDTEDYIEGLKKGQFFNSVTGEILGDSFNGIVVYVERVFNEYKPNRGGFVATHPHAEGERLIRDKGEYPYVSKGQGENRRGEGNELVETLTFILVDVDRLGAGPIILSMSSTSLKHGKAFLSKASMLKREDGSKRPLFESIFNFETRRQENEKGAWYQIVKGSITRVGTIKDEHALAIKKAYELFKSEGVDYSKAEDNSDVADDEPF